jgi:hypothetical protein
MEIGVTVVVDKGELVAPSITVEHLTRDALAHILRLLSYNLPAAHLNE